MQFTELGLKPELLRAVADKGYTVPSPIQQRAIPAVLTGRDVLAGAQTGTGKTAGFVLPILQRLGERGTGAPRALILTPTRELAAQVAESARHYGKYTNLRTAVVYGGVSIRPQLDAMRNGCDVLVATPGRLLDLVEQRACNLGGVEVFVLDEADRMLDMGFIHAIRRITKLLPQQRQNLMFSATYADDIRELATRILRDPVSIEVAARNATVDRVDQVAYRVPKDHKRHLLAHLINDGNWHQVLVFTRTKHGANRLAEQLARTGIPTAAIHGNKSQGARVRALDDFKSNKIVALVATEVAARGLDIKELPYVVNYELPNVPEDYVHRIGRTARAGATGNAVSLVAPDEAGLLKDIVKLLRQDVPFGAVPQFTIQESSASERAPAPAQQRSGRSQSGNGGGQRGRQGGGQGSGSAQRRGGGGGGTATRSRGGAGHRGRSGAQMRNGARVAAAARPNEGRASGERNGGGQDEGNSGGFSRMS
ncbi:MAG: DEAD/DEAH box helicase [Steroidobacteraceae bacterium]